MRVLLIGATGRLGAAVHDALRDRHEVVTASRSGGDVTAAAIELPARQRINAVSPTVFTESLDVYGSFFPGFLPVPVRDVAATFVRSIEGPQTGQVYELGN
jgi:uncharacterized protein YbjT (DUF2867 family)